MPRSRTPCATLRCRRSRLRISGDGALTLLAVLGRRAARSACRPRSAHEPGAALDRGGDRRRPLPVFGAGAAMTAVYSFGPLIVGLTHQLGQYLFCSLDEPFLFGYQISLGSPAANERRASTWASSLMRWLMRPSRSIRV